MYRQGASDVYEVKEFFWEGQRSVVDGEWRWPTLLAPHPGTPCVWLSSASARECCVCVVRDMFLRSCLLVSLVLSLVDAQGCHFHPQCVCDRDLREISCRNAGFEHVPSLPPTILKLWVTLQKLVVKWYRGRGLVSYILTWGRHHNEVTRFTNLFCNAYVREIEMVSLWNVLRNWLMA